MPVVCTCIECGKEFKVRPYLKDTAKFCSIECKNNHMKQKRGEWITKICPSCGKSFETLKSKNKKYCSQKCNKERNEKYMVYNCDCCGKEMRIKKTLYQELLDGEREYITCSYECMGQMKHTGYDIKCDNCGKLFYRRKFHIEKQEKHFCSSECEKEYKHKMTYEIRKCEICGKEFECLKKSSQRFCSQKCNSKWQKTLIGINNSNFTQEEIICDYCKNKFYEKQYKIKNQDRHFCSIECRQKWFSEIWSQQEEVKEKSRKTMLKELSSGIISKTNSKPQQLIDSLLTKLNIKFEKEKNIKYYCVDNFLSEYNLMIEVQGDYWHCNPLKFNKEITNIQYDRIIRDKAKHTYIKNKYKIEVLYLWENDIINKIDLCEKLIIEYINKQGYLDNYHSFNYFIDDNKNLKLLKNIIIPYQDIDSCNYNF